VVYAGGGNDTIIGGRYMNYEGQDEGIDGRGDVLNGGAGDDLIVGSGAVSLDWYEDVGDYHYLYAREVLVGGAGNDTIEAGAGAYQQISGGQGADTFVFSDDVFYFAMGRFETTATMTQRPLRFRLPTSTHRRT
jgi:Ca2+-binding RTX toxin-like protein